MQYNPTRYNLFHCYLFIELPICLECHTSNWSQYLLKPYHSHHGRCPDDPSSRDVTGSFLKKKGWLQPLHEISPRRKEFGLTQPQTKRMISECTPTIHYRTLNYLEMRFKSNNKSYFSIYIYIAPNGLLLHLMALSQGSFGVLSSQQNTASTRLHSLSSYTEYIMCLLRNRLSYNSGVTCTPTT